MTFSNMSEMVADVLGVPTVGVIRPETASGDANKSLGLFLLLGVDLQRTELAIVVAGDATAYVFCS